MKNKKAGTRPIGRDVWEALGSSASEVARDLRWLIRQSLNALRIGDGEPIVDPVESKDGTPLREIQLCRIKAEVRAEHAATPDDKALTPAASELFVLIDALHLWAKKQTDFADACQEFARKVGPGAPRRRLLSESNALLAMQEGHALKPRGKAGRPRRVKLSDDDLLRMVQEAREGERTQTAAFHKVAANLLHAEGKHATGSRKDQLANNMRRRLAAALKARK